MAPAGVRHTPTPRRLALGALSIALTAYLLRTGAPAIAHASWTAVGSALGNLTVREILAMTAVWFAGITAHTFVLTGAMPRLSHRRALALNLTGSAVSNLVPFGGAAGIALNRHMTRTWGFSARAFARYTLLTNLSAVVAKLVMPAVALALLVSSGDVVTRMLRIASLSGIGVLAVVVTVMVVALRSPACTRGIAVGVERLLNGTLRLTGAARRYDLAEPAELLRRESAELVADRWVHLSLGMLAYSALQAALLWLALHVFGAGLTVPEVFAGYAVERVLTVLPFTPGGAGVVEVGLSGALIALGGDPLPVLAGVVVYRAFTFGLEIPVGGAGLGLWALQRHAARPRLTAPRLERPRRIAHVSDVYLPALGGIELHVHDLVARQHAAGLEPEVLTPGACSETDDLWVRRLGRGRLRAVRQAQRRVVSGEYDAVHAHLSVWSPFAMLVAWAAARSGVPTVVTMHSLFHRLGPLPRLFAALVGLRDRRVVWTAVSSVAADSVRRSLGVDVTVLPNAVDPESWQTGPRRRERSASAPMCVTIVSVGRLAPRKRPLQLLQLVHRLADSLPAGSLRLVLVGDGPLRREVEAYVRRFALSGVVEVTGRLDRDEIRAVLADADLYVAPAPLESFGIAALEARCAGLPVVASRHSGVGEFVTQGVEGLLVDGDDEMREALRRLVTDHELRDRIATHNRTHPCALTWDAAIARTDDVYLRASAEQEVSTPAEPQAAEPHGIAAGVLV